MSLDGCVSLPCSAMFVIVVFPDHAHKLFLGSEYPLNLLYMNHKTGDLETWFASLDSK